MSLIGSTAGAELEKRGAERVHVGLRRRLSAGQDLSSSVGDTCADLPGGRPVAPIDPRDAEIGERWLAAGRQENVGRFYIAVDHAGLVGHHQRFADLEADVSNPGGLEGPIVGEHVGQ